MRKGKEWREWKELEARGARLGQTCLLPGGRHDLPYSSPGRVGKVHYCCHISLLTVVLLPKSTTCCHWPICHSSNPHICCTGRCPDTGNNQWWFNWFIPDMDVIMLTVMQSFKKRSRLSLLDLCTCSGPGSIKGAATGHSCNTLAFEIFTIKLEFHCIAFSS